MQLLLDTIHYSFSAIIIGIACTWIILIKSMRDSFRFTPELNEFESKPHDSPRVSIILPARNEEGYIGKCLDSLIAQDYSNYEIIAIDDSSEDNTGKILRDYAKKNPKIIHVTARPKPEGWMGKNWACIEGYKKATGSLLLFTDSDTIHKKNTLSLAVSHLVSNNLDALTLIPKMLSLDNWTRITLPMISTFLHTRFSALRVNDPTKKTGYFFGSFFVIKRETYEKVGTHEGVRQEIIEDGALGKKVKESGHKMKMVLGDNYVEAIWARDRDTLWNALKRLIVPLFLQSSKIAVAIFVAVVFLLFVPFPVLAYSLIITKSEQSNLLLLASSIISSVLIYVAAILESKILHVRLRYASLGPIGSLVVISGFFAGMIQAKSSATVSWRGRKYSMKDHIPDSISI